MSAAHPARQFTIRAMALSGLKLGIAVFLVWLVLRKVDLGQAVTIAIGIAPLFAVGAVGFLFLQAVLSAWRWMVISRRTTAVLSFWPALRIFMISQFYNQALPSTVPGDAARVWGAARFGGVPEATIGVFLDRLVTLAALLLLATVGSLGILYLQNRAGLVAFVPGLVLTTGFVVLAIAVAGRRRLLPLLPTGISLFISALGDATHRLFLSPHIIGLYVVSLFIHTLSIATVYALAWGMGLQLSPLACFLVTPVMALAALLPVSVNGWGVREGTLVALLAGFGIDRTHAVALSVVYGLCQLLLGLIGGLFVLFPDGGANAKAPSQNAPIQGR